jgi:hypothetical protein
MVSKYHAHHDIRKAVVIPLLNLTLTALGCIVGVFQLDELGLRLACGAGAVASIALVVGLWRALEWARWVGGSACSIAAAVMLFGVLSNPDATHSWFLLSAMSVCGVYLLLPTTRAEFARARELIALTAVSSPTRARQRRTRPGSSLSP